MKRRTLMESAAGIVGLGRVPLPGARSAVTAPGCSGCPGESRTLAAAPDESLNLSLEYRDQFDQPPPEHDTYGWTTEPAAFGTWLSAPASLPFEVDMGTMARKDRFDELARDYYVFDLNFDVRADIPIEGRCCEAEVVCETSAGAGGSATASLCKVLPTEYELSATNVAVGEPITVTATVTNTCDREESTDVVLMKDGTHVKQTEVTLEGGTSTEVTFETSFETPGEHTLSIFPLPETGVVVGTDNEPPIADASASPTDTTVGTAVQFTDRSTDPDGEIVSWSWEFGDGATSDEPDPTHAYGSAGTYTATLTVTDDEDAVDSDDVTIEVTTDDGDHDPPEETLKEVTTCISGFAPDFPAHWVYEKEADAATCTTRDRVNSARLPVAYDLFTLHVNGTAVGRWCAEVYVGRDGGEVSLHDVQDAVRGVLTDVNDCGPALAAVGNYLDTLGRGKLDVFFDPLHEGAALHDAGDGRPSLTQVEVPIDVVNDDAHESPDVGPIDVRFEVHDELSNLRFRLDDAMVELAAPPVASAHGWTRTWDPDMPDTPGSDTVIQPIKRRIETRLEADLGQYPWTWARDRRAGRWTRYVTGEDGASTEEWIDDHPFYFVTYDRKQDIEASADDVADRLPFDEFGYDGALWAHGHSMGGLVWRTYLKNHGTDRIGKLAMDGTPNKGSPVGDLYVLAMNVAVPYKDGINAENPDGVIRSGYWSKRRVFRDRPVQVPLNPISREDPRWPTVFKEKRSPFSGDVRRGWWNRPVVGAEGHEEGTFPGQRQPKRDHLADFQLKYHHNPWLLPRDNPFDRPQMATTTLAMEPADYFVAWGDVRDTPSLSEDASISEYLETYQNLLDGGLTIGAIDLSVLTDGIVPERSATLNGRLPNGSAPASHNFIPDRARTGRLLGRFLAGLDIETGRPGYDASEWRDPVHGGGTGDASALPTDPAATSAAPRTSSGPGSESTSGAGSNSESGAGSASGTTVVVRLRPAHDEANPAAVLLPVAADEPRSVVVAAPPAPSGLVVRLEDPAGDRYGHDAAPDGIEATRGSVFGIDLHRYRIEEPRSGPWRLLAHVAEPADLAATDRVAAILPDVAVPLQVTDAGIGRSRIGAGGTATVAATVTNTRTAPRDGTVALSVDGRVVETVDVSLAGGELRTVAFERSFPEPGGYDLAVELAGVARSTPLGTLTVTEGPPRVGDAGALPADPDDDGRYEDVDGDGDVDADDVRALFEGRADPAVRDNVGAFDFNDNDRFDFDDIASLSDEAE